MHFDPKPDRIERLRLIADRLCYLSERADGLRTRHGLQRAYGRRYRDRFDALALEHERDWRETAEAVTA